MIAPWFFTPILEFSTLNLCVLLLFRIGLFLSQRFLSVYLFAPIHPPLRVYLFICAPHGMWCGPARATARERRTVCGVASRDRKRSGASGIAAATHPCCDGDVLGHCGDGALGHHGGDGSMLRQKWENTTNGKNLKVQKHQTLETIEMQETNDANLDLSENMIRSRSSCSGTLIARRWNTLSLFLSFRLGFSCSVS